ncbi:MAG: trigger factor [Oscillospiraceae bacterium]|nr:trigger factor [Oscillospiraceae bacterium]MBQ5712351.1 trigger factor [Oscillospiraceae bacterium]
MSFTYKGLSGTLEKHIVTDTEVEHQLQRLVQQTPRFAEIKDRPAQLGDEVILDYAGFCDGEQFAGGTAEDQSLTLGSGMFIPGFEEQLVGKAIDEKVIVEVTFPEQYHSEALAGKAAQFHCTIHQIRVKGVYEADDTFAKEVGGCDTIDQMRARLKEGMQAYADQQGEMELQDSLLRQAAETLELTFSEEEISAAVDRQMDTMKAQLAQQGLSLEMYCSFMDTTEEALRADARAAAMAQLRSEAVVLEIARLEGIEATKEEIGEAIAVIAHQNDMTVEQLKPYYDAQFEAAVIRSVVTTKVMALIRENATVTVTEK